MHTTGLDLIVRRQHTRSKRDLVFACAIVLLATFGLGTLSASARTAGLGTADITTMSR